MPTTAGGMLRQALLDQADHHQPCRQETCNSIALNSRIHFYKQSQTESLTCEHLAITGCLPVTVSPLPHGSATSDKAINLSIPHVLEPAADPMMPAGMKRG